MKRVVIVGGGITGLAVAHALEKAVEPCQVTLLEGDAQLGGNLRTLRHNGYVIDAGPDSWVAAKPHATALAREVGLGDELMGTREESRRVYVVWERRLQPLPDGMHLGVPTEIRPILDSDLLGWDAKLRAGLDLVVPRREWRDDDDESIQSFVTRRLGADVAERIAGPLLGGIFAGDARALSVRACVPQLVEAERKHGSLVRAMRELREEREAAAAQIRAARAIEAEREAAEAEARAAKERAEAARLAEEGDEEKPESWRMRSRRPPRPIRKIGPENVEGQTFLSLKRGVGDLVVNVAHKLRDAEVITGRRATRIASLPAGDPRGRWVVETTAGDHFADDVALALPAWVVGGLLRGVDPDLQAMCEELVYASTATVFLAYRKFDVRHPLDGFGFLVPQSEGRPILACTFVSSKWDHRAPAGQVLLRVFLGGAGNEHQLSGDDDELVRIARSQLHDLLGIDRAPMFTRVFRFDKASPQPYVGHLPRVRRLLARVASHPGLHVGGSGYIGTGIPDAVKQGEEIAARISPLSR